MTGKILVLAIVFSALLAGAGLYYLQVYGYYEDVTDPEIRLTRLGGEAEPILIEDFEGIDATSSPIRFRACFTAQSSLATLTETYEIYEGAEPLVAPGWFSCFDADGIATELRDGAVAFLGEKNIEYGVDRVVAVFPDGRGFAWHQLNGCGQKAYDGTPVGETCPARE
ncbi:hypothetical protein SAMN05421688_0418 [Poseidonocella pacifica]|uniref:Histidine kinase n=1 Tax=Poseidonocella pacifica TaxID=871651 RepID=A0A1I0V905_9RHOB|nr:DUF6446 family protein [Poseidonocella pacifica]SFA72811.1 hypothetical protein SAMN05421688_0418 [Poseidonocella pacifica]